MIVAPPIRCVADVFIVRTGQKYNAMGERELKKLCKENGLSPRGSKKDMVKRLGA